MLLDTWKTWTREFTPSPNFNVKEYQESLDRVVGKSRGRSIMKVEWGGDATIVQYTQWDPYGKPVKAEIVPRYSVTRVNEFGMVDHIPIQRWIISELMEGEQLQADDPTNVSFTDENGTTCVVTDKNQFQYTPYIYVGDHSDCPTNCCEKRLCLGKYKVPGVEELDYLRECTWKLRQEFFADPYSQHSEDVTAKINVENKAKQEKRLESQENAFNDESKDWWNAHSHRITDEDPSVLSHGRFKFFKNGKPV